jgi:hypothetical protein
MLSWCDGSVGEGEMGVFVDVEVEVLTATVDEARLGDADADGRSSNLKPPGPVSALGRRTTEGDLPAKK